MARNWAILAVLAVFAAGWTCTARAADGPGASKGTRQLVFSFDSWSLGSYNGGVGIRYFLADDVAIRPGLDFRIEDVSDNDTSEGDITLMADSTSLDIATFGLSVFLEKYVGGLEKLTPFLGVGLGYAYSSSDNMQIHHTYRRGLQDGYWSDCYHRTSHTIDIMGTLGLQWYFTDHISLGGQYNLTVSHKWEDRDQTLTSYDGETPEVSTRRNDSDDTVVGVDAGRLLVSIRF